MKRGFYLVSKDADKKKEVEVFKKLNNGVDIQLVNFEEIIPIAGDLDKIKTINGEMDFPDFVFVRAFDLGEKQYHLKSVLEMLEYNNVLCINSTDTKEKTSDKLLTSQIVSSVAENIKVPKTILVTPDIDGKIIVETLGLPLVVKVIHGSGGKGLSLINSTEELDNLLNLVFAAPFNDQIIAQEAIMTSKGRDARIVIANGEIIDSFIRSNPDDFKSNVHQGGSLMEFEPSESLKNDAVKIANALNLKLGSIDFLFGENEDEFYFCEANSTIGLPYLLGEDKEKISKYSNLLEKLF